MRRRAGACRGTSAASEDERLIEQLCKQATVDRSKAYGIEAWSWIGWKCSRSTKIASSICSRRHERLARESGSWWCEALTGKPAYVFTGKRPTAADC